MKADSIQDSTRYIVSELHRGSIIPGNRAEMWRSIYLDSGANIVGGIWGGELEITGGDIKVDDSTYIRGSISILKSTAKKAKGSDKDEIEFGSTVTSSESLSINKGAPITRFCSDLYVGQLNLRNAIVYGNIYCANARIENCIILGGIYCRGKLELTNSIVFVFKTNTLILNENVSLLAPYSISKEKFELNYPIRALTFYNILNASDGDINGTVVLDEDDVFLVKYAENESVNDSEGQPPPFSNVYILSIVERILNSQKIIEQFRKNKELIEFLAFGNNILEEFSEQFKQFTKDDLEKALWSIIDKGVIDNEIDEKTNFDELLNNFTSSDDTHIHKFKKINTERKKDEHLDNIKCGECGAEFENADLKFCLECGSQIK